MNKNSIKRKQPYTLQVEPQHEEKIKNYLETKKKDTGISIRRLHTEMLLKQIEAQ